MRFDVLGSNSNGDCVKVERVEVVSIGDVKAMDLSSDTMKDLELASWLTMAENEREREREKTVLTELKQPCNYCPVKLGMIAWMIVIVEAWGLMIHWRSRLEQSDSSSTTRDRKQSKSWVTTIEEEAWNNIVLLT